jgi:hypothetical protein
LLKKVSYGAGETIFEIKIFLASIFSPFQKTINIQTKHYYSQN